MTDTDEKFKAFLKTIRTHANVNTQNYCINSQGLRVRGQVQSLTLCNQVTVTFVDKFTCIQVNVIHSLSSTEGLGCYLG